MAEDRVLEVTTALESSGWLEVIDELLGIAEVIVDAVLVASEWLESTDELLEWSELEDISMLEESE